MSRFGEDAGEQVQVKPIDTPNLGSILDMNKDDAFSIFNAKHATIAGKLIELFLGNLIFQKKLDAFISSSTTFFNLKKTKHWIFLSAAKSSDELLSLAVYSRERVNPYMFQYAFSVALLHRKDTQHLKLPSIVSTFPDRFFHSKILGKAREHASIVPANRRVRINLSLLD